MGSEVTAVLEDYLEAIAELAAPGGGARTGEIAARVGVHKSTVTAALHSLSAKGLVNYSPYVAVSLTEPGGRVAARVCRRHRVLRRFLGDILGLSAGAADAAACRLEHVVDRDCLDRLALLVDFLESSADWQRWSEQTAWACEPRGRREAGTG